MFLKINNDNSYFPMSSSSIFIYHFQYIAITEEERIFHLIANKYFRHSKQDPDTSK